MSANTLHGRRSAMTENTNATSFHDSTLDGNEQIENAIKKYATEKTNEALAMILHAIHVRMNEGGHMIITVITSGDGTEFTFRSIQLFFEADAQVREGSIS